MKLSSYVQGQVHLRQLTDVPLATVPKRLQLGSKIKCRVLHVHKARRQLTLTAKKSLVKSEFQLTRRSFQKEKHLIRKGSIKKVVFKTVFKTVFKV